MKNKLHIFVLLALTAVAYLNIFQNGFVIDDQYFIVEKSADPVSQQGVFRPIRSLLYTIYFQIFGTANPAGYHLHSLLVHLMATGLVYLIMSVIARTNGTKQSSIQMDRHVPTAVGTRDDKILPFIAALLFGLHPIHTESITYIAASMEMTGIVFMLASFYFYIRNPFGFPLRKGEWLSLLFATLAFFTYEMTLTLPLLLLLYEGVINHAPTRYKKTLPYFAILVFYLVTRFWVGVGLARGDYLAYSPYHTFLTMIKMVVKYIWLLIWPVNLSHNHTVVPGFEAFMTPYSDQWAILRQSILDPDILLSFMVIVVIIAFAVIHRKRYPLISFGIGWFFVSLLPVLYIFPQGTAIAEKYLYLASVGFVMVIAWAINKLKVKSKKLKVMVVILIALFYGGRTYLRNLDWRSPITLWEYETRIHPKSELAFYSLGVYYGQSGQKEKAIGAYKKALEIKPQFWQAENNLRNLLK